MDTVNNPLETERELRQMARTAIEEHPYIRYQLGQFDDPEKACCALSIHGLTKEAKDPTSALSRIDVVYHEIMAMPGGVVAMAQFEANWKSLTDDDFPTCRSRSDLRKVVRVFEAYARRRLSALIRLKLELTVKGERRNDNKK